MIKTNFQIEKKEGQKFDPLPENVYQVELLDIEMKEKPNYKKTGLENVLEFQFTLLNGKDKSESLRGRNIWRNFVPTCLYVGKNGKNVLYQIIEAIDGQEMSPEREATLDTAEINSLIGKQCRVVTKNKKDGDKVFSNIESFLTIENELPKLTQEEKEKATLRDKKEEKTEAVYPEEESVVDTSRIPF